MKEYKYNLDRLGNAQRFVDEYEDRIRYVSESRAWFVWDGKRWAEDRSGTVVRLAAKSAKRLYDFAEDKLISNDQATKLFKWARASCDDRTIGGVLKLASTDLRVVVSAEKLDADPWVLNVENGTLDLRTGKLREHDPADLITKLAPVTYDPNAESPVWNRALEDATDCDAELMRFLQRAAGYTLVGVTHEEALLFVYGAAATGKSTVTGPLKRVLGDYAVSAQVESFLARVRTGNAASSDIARLAGVRMILTSEPERGEKLASGILRNMVAGDEITARHLFKEAFDFKPQATLWFVANDRPYVHPGDSGMWRRVLEVPFNHVVPEEDRDPKVKAALLDDPECQSAILAWAVEGCLAWQKDGLNPPKVIRDATTAYQRQMNPLSEFIADECHIEEGTWTSTAELYARYVKWYQGRSDNMMRQKRFVQSLETVPGLSRSQETTGKKRRGISGIKLTLEEPYSGASNLRQVLDENAG